MAVADALRGGLYRLQFWIVASSNNYMQGDQTTLSNGATTNAVMIDSVNATTAATRQIVNLDFEGGDALIGTMQFGETSFAPFTITFDSEDADNLALIHGTGVDTTINTAFAFFTNFTNSATVRNVGIMLTQKVINRDGSDGGSGFLNYVFPLCQVTSSTTIGGFQAKTQSVWNVTPQRTTRTPHGTLFSATTMSIPSNTADHYIVKSTYPLAWATQKSDAAATTFTPAYKALSSTVTSGASENYMAKNGAITALSAVNTTTGLMTLAAAGTAGDYHVVMYETNFVSTS